MLKKVAENIFLFIVDYPGSMGETNCYLIKGENGYTIIDTGMYSKEAIAQWEHLINVSGMKIEKVVLTHVHRDHVGLAGWFKERYGVPIVMSSLSVKEMALHAHPQFETHFKQLLLTHGVPSVPERIEENPFIYEVIPDVLFNKDDKITLGDDVYEIIWTPGHAWDHFCFYQREKRILFIGDHVLENLSPVIGLWEGEERNVLQAYFDSLQLMENYPTDIALPGHGNPIYMLEKRVKEIKQSHERRLEQVLFTIEDEEKSAFEVCLDVYGMLKPMQMISPFMATLTRLLYLEGIGKASRKEKNGVVTFVCI